MSGASRRTSRRASTSRAWWGPVLAQSYHSRVVDRLKELGYTARAGEVRVKLAREFGFCYGVDRAVEYAYEAREQFPDRRIFLSGEIIHNPEVNGRIEALGIRILPDDRRPRGALRRGRGDGRRHPARLRRAGRRAPAPAGEGLRPRRHDLRQRAQRLEERPPLRARRLHRRSSTASTTTRRRKATASQALDPPRRALPLRAGPRRRPQLVCDFIRGDVPAAALLDALPARRRAPASTPTRDLQRIGLANQTTMLMTREPRDPGDAARGHARTARARRRSPSASAPSTPSAPPPRTGRTRCWRCWRRAAST